MQLSCHPWACCLRCVVQLMIALALIGCVSSARRRLEADRKFDAIVSILPASGPLIDNSGSDAHRRVKELLMNATRFVFAERVSYHKIRLLKNHDVLPPIDATLVRSAVRTSKWGEFPEKMFGRPLWVVFFDENGQLAGALYGRYRHYEVHLGTKQLKSGIIELSDCVEPFIRTSEGKFLARKMPPGSPNPVRICDQGIIFKHDPFDPHGENF